MMNEWRLYVAKDCLTRPETEETVELYVAAEITFGRAAIIAGVSAARCSTCPTGQSLEVRAKLPIAVHVRGEGGRLAFQIMMQVEEI